MTWSNGDVYKGDWVDGKRQGRAEMKIQDRWIQGIFNNDELVDAKFNKIIDKNLGEVKKFNTFLHEEEIFLQPEPDENA